MRTTVRTIPRKGYPEHAALGEFRLDAEADPGEVVYLCVVEMSECPAPA